MNPANALRGARPTIKRTQKSTKPAKTMRNITLMPTAANYHQTTLHDNHFNAMQRGKSLVQSTSTQFDSRNSCNAVDSGIDSNSFIQQASFGVDENLKESPTNFASMREAENCSTNQRDKERRARSPQMTLHEFFNVKRHATNCDASRQCRSPAPPSSTKRTPFADISNTLDTDSPKSRLEALKPKTKRRALRTKANATLNEKTTKCAKISPEEGQSPPKPLTLSQRAERRKATTSNDDLSHSSSNSSLNESTRKRTYAENAYAENALTHLDETIIPETARARTSFHRAHSSSVLEVSHISLPISNESSPDKLTHYSLVTVENPSCGHSAYGSLSGNTLRTMLESMSTEEFTRKFILIDCRFPYEYDGGHIMNAINLYNSGHAEAFFYPADQTRFLEINAKIPIFYCEYSQKRGPSMALMLRKLDRARNENRYPKIDYKEMYVLDRGYRQFFQLGYQGYCTPPSYVPMIHHVFNDELTHYKKFMKRSNSCSLYGTEARFHQHASAERFEELISCWGQKHRNNNNNSHNISGNNVVELEAECAAGNSAKQSDSGRGLINDRAFTKIAGNPNRLRHLQVELFKNFIKNEPSLSVTSTPRCLYNSFEEDALEASFSEEHADELVWNASSKRRRKRKESSSEIDDLELIGAAVSTHITPRMQQKFLKMSVRTPRSVASATKISNSKKTAGVTAVETVLVAAATTTTYSESAQLNNATSAETSPFIIRSRDQSLRELACPPAKRRAMPVSPILEELSPNNTSR